MKKITIEDKGFTLRIKQADSTPIPTLHKGDQISLVYTVDVTVDALVDPVMCDQARAHLLMRLEEQIDQIIGKARKDIGD